MQGQAWQIKIVCVCNVDETWNLGVDRQIQQVFQTTIFPSGRRPQVIDFETWPVALSVQLITLWLTMKPQKMGRIHRSAMYIQIVTDSLAAQHHPKKELAAQHASQNLVLLEVWNWIIELKAGNKTDALGVLNVWIDGSFLVNRNLFFITLCGWWNIHLVR